MDRNGYKNGGYNGGNRNKNFNPRQPVEREKITNENYVKTAEDVMEKLIPLDSNGNRQTRNSITTSKIRGLLTNISGIYNDVVNLTENELNEDILSRIQYLKVQFIYESGREKVVKAFVDEADILNQLEQIGKDKKQFICFARYLEALVAYHKFYGGE